MKKSVCCRHGKTCLLMRVNDLGIRVCTGSFSAPVDEMRRCPVGKWWTDYSTGRLRLLSEMGKTTRGGVSLT